MTRDECTFLLARFTRCFGRHLPDVATVDEWTRFLTDVPAKLAHDQLDRAVREGDRGPSLSLFVERCRAEQRRLALRDQTTPVEEPPVSIERALQHIATIRAQLEDRTDTDA